MSVFSDIKFCLKPRCPVCRKGRLFRPHSITVVPRCAECDADLGAHDIGDGASVFLIFFFGITIIPLAWWFENAVHPPLWLHGILWLAVMLGAIALLLPVVKAYIIMLEWRHRKG
ncbi:MAG: DUF983 domain-containing protein [Alphaproteobacteria bacterium]|nr:DUF983 domain-containing protein [Alphaproteobacteria bacterium]